MVNNGKIHMYDVNWDVQPKERHVQRSAFRNLKNELNSILGKHIAWDGKVYSTVQVMDPFTKSANADG